MPSWSRLAIGLMAVLLLGWIYQGPLGNGERFIDTMERQARAAVASTNLAGIKVEMGRHPLSRLATMSGPANDFQRNGMGSLKGLTALVEEVPGIARVQWADEPRSGIVLPLLAETLLLVCGGYLLGLALALLFFRRRRDGRYAD